MATPIAVATSDTHIDDYAWADRADLAGDSQYAFQQICDYAIRHELPIIAAGDLLDSKLNEAMPIEFLRGQLDRLAAADVSLCFTQGQHELQPRPWLSSVHDWPTWLHREAKVIGGRWFYGIDWQPREQLPEQLATVPEKTEVLVMHQVCQAFMGSVTAPELDFAQIPHARLLVIGDYHVHKVLRSRGAAGQELRVLSPGATHMRKIDEPHEHRFFVIHDDLTAKSVRLRSRLYCERTLLFESDVDDFVAEIGSELRALTAEAQRNKLPPALQRPMLRVHYLPGLPDVYDRVLGAVGDLGFVWTKVLPELRSADETSEAAAEIDDNGSIELVDCLAELVDEAAEPEVYELCRALLTEEDQRAAMSRVRQKIFTQEVLHVEEP